MCIYVHTVLNIALFVGLSKDVLFSVSSGMSRLRAQLSVDLNRRFVCTYVRTCIGCILHVYTHVRTYMQYITVRTNIHTYVRMYVCM